MDPWLLNSAGASEDYDPILEEPLARQQALASRVRPTPKPRRSPAMTLPTSAVETPPPENYGATPPPGTPGGYGAPGAAPTRAPGVAPGPGGYRGMASSLAQQALDAVPSEMDLEGVRQFAKKRGEDSDQNFKTGMVLSLMGDKAFSPVGQHILKQAMAAQEPLKFGGGFIEGGQFIADPYATAQHKAQRLEAQAKLFESMAQHADTIEQRREAAAQAVALRTALAGAAGGRRSDAADARQQAQNYRMEDNTRNHFDQITKDTRDVLNQSRVLQQMPANGVLTPVQQGALIYMINKFADPGSVVREGEYDRVAAAQGLLQKWGNIPQKLQSGQPLPPALQRDLQQAIKMYTVAAENTMRDTAADYAKLAKTRGLDFGSIVTDARWHPKEAGQSGGALGRGSRVSPIQVRPGAPGAGPEETIKVTY